MAGAPYTIDCTWSDDETPTFALACLASGGSALDTSSMTFEYVVRDSCDAKVTTLTQGAGITNGGATGAITFTLPTLAVGRYSHGCRFSVSGVYTQLFDGSIVVSEGDF